MSLRKTSLRWPLVLAALGVAASFGACKTNIGDPLIGPAGGQPCAREMDCPVPNNPCYVATCWESRCQYVATAEGTLMASEAQTKGDCLVSVCDGRGQVKNLVDPRDLPPDDKNPCTDEVCENGAPAFPPLAVGAACERTASPEGGEGEGEGEGEGDQEVDPGEPGFCNGKGTCGECLPGNVRCVSRRVDTCNEEGSWAATESCSGPTPLCGKTSCLKLEEVVPGQGISCARFEDAQLLCWGSVGGQDMPPAKRIAGLEHATMIAVGNTHSCAATREGFVRCWGGNAFGQLGDGTLAPQRAAVEIDRVKGVSEVAVGDGFSCALLGTAAVMCWGANDVGQLGRGTTTKSSPGTGGLSGAQTGQSPPSAVRGAPRFKDISLGDGFGCGRKGDDSVWCWGFWEAQLGEPPPAGHKPMKAPAAAKPEAVKGLKTATQIVAGAAHACALLADETAVCWGKNDRGQLGDGTTKDRSAPVAVKGLTGAKSLLAGQRHSCARTATDLVCWGDNASRQLGTADAPSSAVPIALPNMGQVLGYKSGGDHLCAWFQNGVFRCWGGNSHGQLGNNETTDSATIVDIQW